ncbi:Mu transposase domain-containing protein [Rugamonas sp. DEMB1]|uniref:Mu transposase domain-containing protein n=1 Tax=Rugamonas sp. DEMB1 TaxID=3039386 RepID=UPI00391D43A9
MACLQRNFQQSSSGNQRPFKKLQGSRASAFAEMHQPTLRLLPERGYEYAERKVARVSVDYRVDGHYYSVQYRHAQAQVDARTTRTAAEPLQRGQRIAGHAHCTFKTRARR